MKKWILPVLCCALTGSVGAQTGRATSGTFAPDSAAIPRDTLWHGVAFSPLNTFEEPQPTTAARARDERASTRSAPRAEASSSSSGTSIERTKDGPQLNVQRALDPDGRKHWLVQNKRSTRRSPNSPPGTEP